MKLEKVLKRYPGGESDIIVKCIDLFSTDKLLRTHGNKLYPGGDVRFWNLDPSNISSEHELYESFFKYMNLRNISQHFTTFTIYQIAAELNLEASERYKFLSLDALKREAFLLNQIKYQTHILSQEQKMRDSYHLN